MNEQLHGRRPRRRGRLFLAMTFRTIGALFSFGKKKISDDTNIIWENSRLFIGLLSFVVGVLSFQADRFCDGNSSSYYACTRPATYYYYPSWAVFLVVVGAFLVVLWFLRNKRS